jgi:hypothetical protein
VLAVVLGAVGGTGIAERAAERTLRRRFAPIKRVRVDVSRGHRSPFSRTIDQVRVEMEGFAVSHAQEPLKMGGGARMSGKVSRLMVDARDFEVRQDSGGLRVRQLEFALTGIRYNFGKALLRRRLVLLGLGPGSGRVVLDEKALNDFLAPRVKQLEDFRLDLLDRRIRVRGARALLGVRFPVELEGSLRAHKGEVHLVLPRIRMGFLPVPGFVTRRVLSQVNPLVDLNQGSGGPFRFDITSLRVKKDILEVEVKAEPVSAAASFRKAQSSPVFRRAERGTKVAEWGFREAGTPFVHISSRSDDNIGAGCIRSPIAVSEGFRQTAMVARAPGRSHSG